METNTNPHLEIDLFFLLNKLWNRKFFITLMASLFGTVALAYSLFLVVPQYSSTTRIYVVNQNQNTNTITTQELVAGDYLVKDYREIILSKDVMSAVYDSVIEDGVSPQAISNLSRSISVNSPINTRVISISATDPDPKLASYLANKVREEAAKKIKDVTKVEEITTLEAAEPSNFPVSPNIKRNALLGFLVGGFLAIVGLLVKEILDDHVKRPEDIEEVLGLTLLGLVPDEGQL